MSVADDFMMTSHFTPAIGAEKPESDAVGGECSPASPAAPAKRHRLAEVRRQQGVSVRSAARRMGVPMDQVRREEKPDSDLTLSDMARWQVALEVPLVDLLQDNDAPISAPVLKRAKWLRLMKTVKALGELEATPAVARMTQMLEQQVTEVMPELADVGAWHSVGQRRTQDELGRITEDLVPTTFARDSLS